VTTYREQRRGGIGVMGMEMKEDDYIKHLFVASTHDYILFFTNVGKVYRLKVHELPLGSRQSKGTCDRQPAAVPPGRAGARSDPDARLRASSPVLRRRTAS
jgi:DNA gyrase/topoisomerase IV subunit A